MSLTDAYPMSRLEEVIGKMANASHITVIDAMPFYYQWLVHSDSRWALSVITHDGQYGFNVLIMGYNATDGQSLPGVNMPSESTILPGNLVHRTGHERVARANGDIGVEQALVDFPHISHVLIKADWRDEGMSSSLYATVADPRKRLSMRR
ncbi:hypothetical protein E4U52_004503 [Claviceps spartinae]|nr:hypothetical protein E4U52_004503 [Claviceps spartinae]